MLINFMLTLWSPQWFINCLVYAICSFDIWNLFFLISSTKETFLGLTLTFVFNLILRRALNIFSLKSVILLDSSVNNLGSFGHRFWFFLLKLNLNRLHRMSFVLILAHHIEHFALTILQIHRIAKIVLWFTAVLKG